MDKKDTVPTELEDKIIEGTLRPRKLGDFVGQDKTKDNLRIMMGAAKKRQEVLEHILLFGPPGLGKTTLAHIIAAEMGSDIKVTSGPAIERAGDLAAILTNLNNGDVLFIDEIHRLSKVVSEVLYPAMEDYCLDIVIGKGPSARTLRVDLPKFTLIGATTRSGLLSAPFRDRFGSVYRLDYYQPEDLARIIQRSAKILNVVIDKQSIDEIAKRSRGTPRVANRLLKRVRDYCQVNENLNSNDWEHLRGGVAPAAHLGGEQIDKYRAGSTSDVRGAPREDTSEVKQARKELSSTDITLPQCVAALDMLAVDKFGLDDTDRQLLRTIIEKHNGGPVGLSTLAATISEDVGTIEEVIEPYLLQIGFLRRTPRGRAACARAFTHLGFSLPKGQSNLF